MHQLTIVGLGPGDSAYLTMQALTTLQAAERVLLRTAQHPIVDQLAAQGIAFESYDDYYEKGATFDAVYRAIADDILTRLAAGPVVYAVPGNPFVAERTVELLKAAYSNIEYVHGASFIDALITALAIDPVNGLRIVDSLDLKPFMQLNDDVLVCIQCYDAVVASQLKIWLGQNFDDEQPVLVVQSAGIKGSQKITELPLYQLDRHRQFDHLTSVVIIPQADRRRYQLAQLMDIVKLLRSENGCPWDRQQTHQSLKDNLLEEAYEVAEALEKGDLFELEEELGDLLLQVVFHAQIASENGDFMMTDITDGISQKLIRRHPHVFGDDTAQDAEQVKRNWEAIKRAERQHDTTAQVMAKYSKGLPALFRSEEVIGKAIKSGFDWENVDQAIAKVKEEIAELIEAIAVGDKGHIEEELGDLLFASCVAAKKLGIAPEHALQKSVDKFIARYQRMEKLLEKRSLALKTLDLAALVAIWRESK